MAKYGPENLKLQDGREVELRHCVPADAPLLDPFRRKIASETTFTLRFPGEAPLPIDRVASRWRAAAEDPHLLCLGAFAGGKMVGQLEFRVARPDHPWIRHIGTFGMMIERDFWGRGIGRRMVEILEERARSGGVTRIEAHVRAANGRAVRFYREAGYAIEGTRRAAALVGGRYEDELFIAKILAAGS